MKHLILLFDGTWNSAATGHFDDITNVFRSNQAISRHDKESPTSNPQITTYIPGPGTRGMVDEQLGGAFGQGIDQIIREAYVNLASNFDPGDLIYLFGFSRGAIAARALACLIDESGLLTPSKMHLLPIAWKRFVNKNQKIVLHAGLQDLSRHVHSDVRIKFMGLFDTVLGREASTPTPFSDLVFSDSCISSIVDHAVHIVSIDDNREVFAPLLWGSPSLPEQRIKQIWMPGVHGDVGGIGKPMFLGTASLLTMLAEVIDYTSLNINESVISEYKSRVEIADSIEINDERLSRFWWPFPKVHRTFQSTNINQYRHCLVEALHLRNFMCRGSMSIYRGERLAPFLQLPEADHRFSDMIRSSAIDALEKMH